MQFSTSHSTSRLSDILTRLSGRFQHAFNTSATDLSLLHLINTIPSSSPKGNSSALLTAATPGTGHFHKSTRYLPDSGSTLNNLIWLLDLLKPGY